MKSIYDEIRKFIFLFQIFALCPFGRNKLQNYILGFYSLLYIVVLVVLSLIAMYYNQFMYNSNAISALVVGLLFLGNLLTFVMIILQAFVSRNDLKKFLLEIGYIDEIFEIKLHVPIDYGILQRKYLFKMSIILLVSNGLLLFIVLFLALGSRKATFLFWLPVSFSIIVINIRFTQNIFFVDLLRQRLEFLNQRLMEVAQRKLKKSKLVLYANTYDHQHQLKKKRTIGGEFDEVLDLKRIYGMIWNASILLNDSFGWSVLAMVTRSFIGFTCHGYWLFLGFKGLIDFDLIVDSAVNFVVIALQLSTLCLACHNCTSCVSSFRKKKNKMRSLTLLTQCMTEIFIIG